MLVKAPARLQFILTTYPRARLSLFTSGAVVEPEEECIACVAFPQDLSERHAEACESSVAVVDGSLRQARRRVEYNTLLGSCTSSQRRARRYHRSTRKPGTHTTRRNDEMLRTDERPPPDWQPSSHTRRRLPHPRRVVLVLDDGESAALTRRWPDLTSPRRVISLSGSCNAAGVCCCSSLLASREVSESPKVVRGQECRACWSRSTAAEEGARTSARASFAGLPGSGGAYRELTACGAGAVSVRSCACPASAGLCCRC
eukprot:scaffold4609_cov323-Prasinococcus_capsulatus_cf.AAC.3